MYLKRVFSIAYIKSSKMGNAYPTSNKSGWELSKDLGTGGSFLCCRNTGGKK
jgi:hypothetical protein